MYCTFKGYLILVLKVRHFSQLHKFYTIIFQFCALDWPCGHILPVDACIILFSLFSHLCIIKLLFFPILITCTLLYVMVTWLQLEQEVKNYFPTIKYMNFTILYSLTNQLILPQRVFEFKHGLPSIAVRTGAVFPQFLQSCCSFLHPLLIVLGFSQQFCSWWKISFPADSKKSFILILVSI